MAEFTDYRWDSQGQPISLSFCWEVTLSALYTNNPKNKEEATPVGWWKTHSFGHIYLISSFWLSLNGRHLLACDTQQSTNSCMTGTERGKQFSCSGWGRFGRSHTASSFLEERCFSITRFWKWYCSLPREGSVNSSCAYGGSRENCVFSQAHKTQPNH